MSKDMLGRFVAMEQDARGRSVSITRDQIATLVLADVIEDQGLAATKQLEEIDRSLVAICKNV